MTEADIILRKMENQNQLDAVTEERRQKWIKNVLVGLVIVTVLALGVALTSTILSVRFGDSKSDQLVEAKNQLEQSQEQLAGFTEQSACRSKLAADQATAESAAAQAGRDVIRSQGRLIEAITVQDPTARAEAVEAALTGIHSAIEASDAADAAALAASTARQNDSPNC